MARMTCQREYCCLCWSCHVDRLNENYGKLPEQLLRESSVSQNVEIACRKEAFKQVLKQIAIHKAFRQQMYAIYKYKNTACYFKSIEGGGLNQAEAAKIVKPINIETVVLMRISTKYFGICKTAQQLTSQHSLQICCTKLLIRSGVMHTKK